MAEDQNQGRLLHGLVEADETYVGGMPGKPNKRDPNNKKRGSGRGTDKTAVLGAIERGGRVVAEPTDSVGGRAIQSFIRTNVDRAGTLLLTDQWGGYRRIGRSSMRTV